MSATNTLLSIAALAASCALLPVPAADDVPLEAIAPRAVAWAERLASGATVQGVPLTAEQRRIAAAVGVRHPEEVRLLVVERIPLPDEPLLEAAAVKVGLSSSSAAGLTLGHAVIVRRGWERDLRILSHELRHVAQYEAAGGIPAFLATHLAHLARHGYRDSPYEVDARAHELDAAPAKGG